MKILYIESKQKNLLDKLPSSEIKKLPKKLLLLYTIQYQDLAKKIKKQLQANNIKIQRFQQVLGCSNINNKNKLPVLLIGTGEFHAINLYLQSPIIYTLENNKITQIPQSKINKLKAHRKTALLKFLTAENMGILVSTKPGQENLKLALNLKEKIEKKSKQRNQNKKTFIFISDNIDIAQFENFNIDSWVNTACPGLVIDDKRIINYSEIK